jgi:hypothetical protein
LQNCARIPPGDGKFSPAVRFIAAIYVSVGQEHSEGEISI